METVNLTSGQLKEAANLKEQIEKAQARLTEILGGAPVTVETAVVGKRTMSKASRAKIAEAQIVRWAKYHAAKAAAATPAPAPAPVAVPTPVPAVAVAA